MNPNATVADTGDEMQAYYDKERKVWVFPGEDTDEKAAPLAPPPIIPRKTEAPELVEPKGPSAADPLAAMMAPPNRRGLPARAAATPGATAKSATSKPPTSSMAAPQFAVFTPK